MTRSRPKTRNMLIKVVKRGDPISIRNFIRAGWNVNEADPQGWTPLFHAAHRGDTEAIRLLVEAGADVNLGIETGFTALFSAVLGGHLAAVRALLQAGARTSPIQGIELRNHAAGLQ